MTDSPLFSFGVAADIQYADKDTEDNKKFYRDALLKFNDCITSWNAQQLNFTIHLGDIIDGNVSEEKSIADLDKILEVFAKNQHHNHHVIGNHCLKLPREYLTKRLYGSSDSPSYYDFTIEGVSGWRCIVLDGTDVSVYGWPTDSENYKEAQEYLSTHSLADYPSASRWNAAIGKKQIAYLEETLRLAKLNEEKVIVFNHYPLLAEAAAPTHLQWNGDEIVSLLDHPDYNGVVVAFFNGHYHPGGYYLRPSSLNSNIGIHFYTMKGILEAKPDSNCFARVDVYNNRIEIRGSGTVQNQILRFHNNYV